jgi:hypothetical protein
LRPFLERHKGEKSFRLQRLVASEMVSFDTDNKALRRMSLKIILIYILSEKPSLE